MFLSPPPPGDANAALYARDVAEDGYVANFTRLWAWRPNVFDAFTDARLRLVRESALSLRERSILVCATAATLGDAYCALAYGRTLAGEVGADTAAAILRGIDTPELTARERGLADWARKVTRAPNATTAEDVDRLRAAGLTDQEIFDVTAFVALRVAFSTVNDALGARPDRQLAASAPRAVRDAVAFGRDVAGQPSI